MPTTGTDPTWGNEVPPTGTGPAGTGPAADPTWGAGVSSTVPPVEPAPVSYTGASVSTTGPAESEQSKTDVAKNEAAQVKDRAMERGSDVAATAKEQAGNVASEVQTQARGLLDQVRSEARGRVADQKDWLASTVHSLSKELGSMASSSSESGPMTDLAHRASQKSGEVAHWLQNHEPSDALDEVRRFARRRPAAFIALCAAAGVVVGRLTRGAVAAHTSLDSRDGGGSQSPAVTSGLTGTADPGYAPGYASGYPVDDGGLGVSTAPGASYAGTGVTAGRPEYGAEPTLPPTGVMNGPGDSEPTLPPQPTSYPAPGEGGYQR